MTRPAFLTTPGVWVRTPRTIQSAVDAACPVSHNVKRASTAEQIASVLLATAIGIVLAALLWHGLAS